MRSWKDLLQTERNIHLDYLTGLVVAVHQMCSVFAAPDGFGSFLFACSLPADFLYPRTRRRRRLILRWLSLLTTRFQATQC